MVEAGVEGGLRGILNLNLHNFVTDTTSPDYGLLRPDDLFDILTTHPECLFDAHGELDAFLQAFLWVGVNLGFSKITLFNKSIDFLNVTLASFDYHCDIQLASQEPTILADLTGGVLTLGMGPNVGLRNKGDGDDETFSVSYVTIDETQKLRVSAFGLHQDFDDPDSITKIVADGGTGSDTITISSDITQDLELSGGQGTDRISVGAGGLVSIYGDDQGASGGDNDVINVTAATGDVTIHLGSGNDRLTVADASGKLTITGDDGNDQITIAMAAEDVVIDGGAGNDSITVAMASGSATVSGGSGDDAIEVDAAGSVLIRGDSGNDSLIGSPADDVIFGGAGNDSIVGGDGNDIIIGDQIQDGSGVELLFISTFTAGSSNAAVEQLVDGGSIAPVGTRAGGSDRIFGGTGRDIIFGGDESGSGDVILGEAGDDLIFGGLGSDLLRGDAARLNGSDLDDTSVVGNDTIHAGGDDDRIYGGPGDDQLFGDDGDDNLSGDQGVDVVVGGDGGDVIHWRRFNNDDTDSMLALGGQTGDGLMASGNDDSETVDISTPDSGHLILRWSGGIDPPTLDVTGAQTLRFDAGQGADLLTLGTLQGITDIAIDAGDAGTTIETVAITESVRNVRPIGVSFGTFEGLQKSGSKLVTIDLAPFDPNSPLVRSFGHDAESGFFSIVLGGQTTAPIAHDASVAKIQSAIELLQLVDDQNNPIDVAGYVTVQSAGFQSWTLTFAAQASEALRELIPSLGVGSGLLDHDDFAGLEQADGSEAVFTTGTVGETQTLSHNGVRGSFTLSYIDNGVAFTSDPIAHDATPQSIEASLNALGDTQFSVSGFGTSASPWNVAFATSTGAAPQLIADPANTSGLGHYELTNANGLATVTIGTQLPSTVDQNQIISIDHDATGGSFTFTRSVTDSVSGLPVTLHSNPIAYDASTDLVARALRVLLGELVSVTGSGTSVDPWLAEILGSGTASVSPLAASVVALTKPDDSPALVSVTRIAAAGPGANEVQQVSHNGADAGFFTLSFTDSSSQNRTTPAIAFDASAEDVQDAFNSFVGVQVAVTIPEDLLGNPIANTWQIEFTGTANDTGETLALLTQEVPALTVSGAAATTDVFTDVVASEGQNEVRRIVHNGTSGRLTLESDGKVVFAAFDASSDELESMFGSLTGFDVSADVSNVGGVTTWTIEFLNSGGAGDITLGSSNLGENLPSGPAEVVVATTQEGTSGEVQQIYSDADDGTFSLSLFYDGATHTTAEFDHDEPVIHLQNELEAIVGDDNVHVSGAGTIESPWRIEFLGDLEAIDVALLTVATLTLTSDSGPTSLTIARLVAGSAAPLPEIQQIYHTGDSGSFELLVEGERSNAIAYDAAAADVQAAIESLSNVTGSVTVAGAGTAADPWIVTFVDEVVRTIGTEQREVPISPSVAGDESADRIILTGNDSLNDSFVVTTVQQIDSGEIDVVVDQSIVGSASGTTQYTIHNASRINSLGTDEDALEIHTLGGNDVVDGSAFTSLFDQIAIEFFTGDGADTLLGTNFNDLLDGGLGDDTYTGFAGQDTFADAGGDDALHEVQDADISLFGNYLVVGHNTGLTRSSLVDDQNASVTGEAPRVTPLSAGERGDTFAATYADHLTGETRPVQIELIAGIFESASLTGGFHNNVFVVGDSDHQITVAGIGTLAVSDWDGDVVLDTATNTEDAFNEYYLLTLTGNGGGNITVNDSGSYQGVDEVYIFGTENADSFRLTTDDEDEHRDTNLFKKGIVIAGQEFFAQQKTNSDGDVLFNVQLTDSGGNPLFETAADGQRVPTLLRQVDSDTGLDVVSELIRRAREITLAEFSTQEYDSHVLVPIYRGNEQKTNANGEKLFHVQPVLGTQISVFHDQGHTGDFTFTFDNPLDDSDQVKSVTIDLQDVLGNVAVLEAKFEAGIWNRP